MFLLAVLVNVIMANKKCDCSMHQDVWLVQDRPILAVTAIMGGVHLAVFLLFLSCAGCFPPNQYRFWCQMHMMSGGVTGTGWWMRTATHETDYKELHNVNEEADGACTKMFSRKPAVARLKFAIVLGAAVSIALYFTISHKKCCLTPTPP